MIGIEEYSFVLGRNIRTVEDIASSCDEQQQVKMRKIGLDKIPTDNDKHLSVMIKEAYSKLENTPDCIIIAHSLPFIRANNQIDEIDSKVPVYYVSGLPCAIMHRAVELAVKLIDANHYRKIVIIGADKAYCDEERTFFGTIMGDGVVAMLLSRDAKDNHILASYVSTTIIASKGENSEPDRVTEFRSKNSLMMRDAILKCMKLGDVDHVDYFITHTSNREFWDGISALLHYPRYKFLDDNIRNTGHLNSHDSFYHYFYWCEQKVVKPGQIVMLINPGFGGTQGCTLIQK